MTGNPKSKAIKRLPPSKVPSIVSLFNEGTQNLMDAHAEAEKGKLGILRAGNSGMAEGQEIVGKCARLTYLRYIGKEVEDTEEDATSKELMFAAGRGNEDLWMDVLVESWVKTGRGVILREEEIPIKWATKSGIPVTGRPDIVLCNLESEPVKGIELKLVSSLWTARDVLNGKPKTPHLIQAAHYSWQLGVPFELWYTSRANYAVTGDWPRKLFPKQGEALASYCSYNEEGEIRAVLPFKMGWYTKFDTDGFLLIKRVEPIESDAEATESGWERTIVSIDRIRNYYEVVLKMGKDKVMPARPDNLLYDGSSGSYKDCKYCPLKSHCDTYEKKGVDQWIANLPQV